MANPTPVLGLVKPEFDQAADVRVINTALDAIDAAFGAVPGDMTIGDDLTVAGDLAVTGATTLSGPAAVGVVAFAGNQTGVPGSVAKTGADGLAVRGVAGGTTDLALLTPAGFPILKNPTGTDDVVFQSDVQVLGNLTVVGTTTPTTPGDLVARSGAATQVTVGAVGASAGVKFGLAGDTNLYRSGAGALKTDGGLAVVGGVSVGNSMVIAAGGLNVSGVATFNASLSVAAGLTVATGVLGVGALGTAAAPAIKLGAEQTGLYAQETSGTNRSLSITQNGVYKLAINEFDGAGTTQTTLGPLNKSFLPATDNTHNLGNTGQKFSVVYAVGGVLTTSLRAVKEDWTPLDGGRALEVARGTRVGSFRYRGLPEQRLGFLADDTDPLLTLDGASADPQTTAALALAALGELSARHEALLARVEELEAR